MFFSCHPAGMAAFTSVCNLIPGHSPPGPTSLGAWRQQHSTQTVWLLRRRSVLRSSTWAWFLYPALAPTCWVTWCKSRQVRSAPSVSCPKCISPSSAGEPFSGQQDSVYPAWDTHTMDRSLVPKAPTWSHPYTKPFTHMSTCHVAIDYFLHSKLLATKWGLCCSSPEQHLTAWSGCCTSWSKAWARGCFW